METHARPPLSIEEERSRVRDVERDALFHDVLAPLRRGEHGPVRCHGNQSGAATSQLSRTA